MADPRNLRVRHAAGPLAAAVVAAGLAGAAAWLRADAAGPPAAPPKEVTVGGIPLFAGWPAAAPDAAFVLSGQTMGYLQPCGCSSPQLGGLERRANLINQLKAKGWPVVGLDLGDLAPTKNLVADQGLLKYKTTMDALREMGYLAVGVGKAEFDANLFGLLAKYSLQKEQPPFTLAGNLVGTGEGGKVVPRDQMFAGGPGQRLLVGREEVAQVGKLAVGVVGVVGPSTAKAVVAAQGAGGPLQFDSNGVVLQQAKAALDAHQLKPPVRVLLYQGTPDEARKVADDFPEYQVILCQSDDPEPPQFPTRHRGPKHPAGQETLVIQVGHKGRYVGVVGAFAKPGGGYDLKYQLVPLAPQFVTPNDAAAVKGNKALDLLEAYAAQVKAEGFLSKVRKEPHPAQLQAGDAKLEYVGSERCVQCHAAEHAKWKQVDAAGHGHSVAYNALATVATRPGLRNFDGDCIQCHVVGYKYQSGFVDAASTPLLKDVGCESCHGPGSAHSALPGNRQFLSLMSPWKQDATDRLPSAAVMAQLATAKPGQPAPVQVTPAEQRVMNTVTRTCMQCHDAENDPHFDLLTYWPKIDHSRLPKAGAPAVPVGRPRP